MDQIPVMPKIRELAAVRKKLPGPLKAKKSL
jgi:hypothetical protein